MREIKLKITLVLLLLLGLKINLLSQDLQINKESRISAIRVEGLKIIDETFLLSTIKSSEGSIISPRSISEDIRNIYKLGFAKDVSVDITPSGDNEYILTFLIIEKPRINKIIFQNNQIISDEDLLKLIGLKNFAILNTDQLKMDVKKIVAEYKKKQFFDIKVFYEILDSANGVVDIVFNIIENPKAYITDINFTGNKYFYSLRLKRLIISQKINCFGWVTGDGTFDENRINADLSVIYQTYADAGFIRVKIHPPRIRIINNKDVSKVIVDFSLEEGDRYKINLLDVTPVFGETLLFDKEELIKNFQLKTGEYFSQSKFFADRGFLDNFYRDRGYAYTNIEINTPINEEEKTIDLTYEIEHKQKVYVNRININGNTKTKDYVIRRELTLQDGQLLRNSKLNESRQNIASLGFFETDTGVTFTENENLDKTIDYDINVKEGLTGTTTASISYTGRNIGGMIKISRDNFLGRGLRVSLEGSYISSNEYSIEALYSDPYFFGFNTSFELATSFSREESLDSNGKRNFFLQKLLLRPLIGKKIWDKVKLYVGLHAEWRGYSQMSGSGKEVLNFYTPKEKYGLSLDLVYSSLNHPFLTSRGIYASIGYNTYGRLVGGDQFDSINTNIQFFKNLDSKDRFVFMARHRFSILLQTSKNKVIPPYERFAIGGATTIRGFYYGSINGASSPAARDVNFDADNLKQNNPDAYRQYKLKENGNMLSLFNFELLFPISVDNSYLKGVVFYDTGNVWSEADTYRITGAKLNYLDYRHSMGLGLRVITPIGVIRLEYGFVINPRPREDPGQIIFWIGSLF